MYKRFRTDLAAEQRELTEGAGSLKGVRASSETRRGFEVTTVEILDREGEKALCKPIGRYITLDLEPLMSRDSECFEDAAELLAELLRGDGYELHHFREEVADGRLVFDYCLHTGPLTTRNAIRILELYDYPPELIAEAYDTQQKLLGKG